MLSNKRFHLLSSIIGNYWQQLVIVNPSLTERQQNICQKSVIDLAILTSHHGAIRLSTKKYKKRRQTRRHSERDASVMIGYQLITLCRRSNKSK